MSLSITLLCLIIFSDTVLSIFDLKVHLDNDGPAVRGSNITFTARVTGYDGSSLLRFYFTDDVQPNHEETFDLSKDKAEWMVQYPRSLYEAGEFTTSIGLDLKYFGYWIPADSASTTFRLTETLNGELVLSQANETRPNNFVAVNNTVHHAISLPEKEERFLKDNTSSVIVYWFKDCEYIYSTTDLSLNYMYTDEMVDHYIEALVVADNEPLRPITTTSTTTTTTTTKPKPSQEPTTKPLSTTSSPNTTKEASTTSTTPQPSSAPADTKSQDIHKILKRSLSKNTKKHGQVQDDHMCHNTTIIPVDKNSTYGYYEKTISVRAPISTINISGLNWLRHGELLNLQVKYTGSPPFFYCPLFKMGQYNITGNETCAVKFKTMSNEFPVIRYFSGGDQHTVVVIIENEVGRTMSRATINIYKATVHAQLSVIVVPVVFCLVAVILIVFGVAYYQHRSRYTIEVADFDFGQQHNFDYKTFTERLRDSFRSALNFNQQEDTDPLTPNTRYDSMT